MRSANFWRKVTYYRQNPSSSGIVYAKNHYTAVTLICGSCPIEPVGAEGIGEISDQGIAGGGNFYDSGVPEDRGESSESKTTSHPHSGVRPRVEFSYIVVSGESIS